MQVEKWSFYTSARNKNPFPTSADSFRHFVPSWQNKVSKSAPWANFWEDISSSSKHCHSNTLMVKRDKLSLLFYRSLKVTKFRTKWPMQSPIVQNFVWNFVWNYVRNSLRTGTSETISYEIVSEIIMTSEVIMYEISYVISYEILSEVSLSSFCIIHINMY